MGSFALDPHGGRAADAVHAGDFRIRKAGLAGQRVKTLLSARSRHRGKLAAHQFRLEVTLKFIILAAADLAPLMFQVP